MLAYLVNTERGKNQWFTISYELSTGVRLEVALTATALPVKLTVRPQTTFDFGECPVKEHVDMLCTLLNTSDSMPVTFQFRRLAHFTSHATNGKIEPGESQDVIFSFAPNQVGKNV